MVFELQLGGMPPDIMGIPGGQLANLALLLFRKGKIKRNLKREFSFWPAKETDLSAVPAKTVSEISGGGALLVHQ